MLGPSFFTVSLQIDTVIQCVLLCVPRWLKTGRELWRKEEESQREKEVKDHKKTYSIASRPQSHITGLEVEAAVGEEGGAESL